MDTTSGVLPLRRTALSEAVYERKCFPMKMNNQNRTFVKQVQVDLLALCDADLVRTVQQWVDQRELDGIAGDESEDIRFLLGYTRVERDTELFSSSSHDVSNPPRPVPELWDAPSPEYLRTRLSEMNVNLFAFLLIPLAFQSLHTSHPEWYEGLTFNAHLANHLRAINKYRRTITKGQGTKNEQAIL